MRFKQFSNLVHSKYLKVQRYHSSFFLFNSFWVQGWLEILLWILLQASIMSKHLSKSERPRYSHAHSLFFFGACVEIIISVTKQDAELSFSFLQGIYHFITSWGIKCKLCWDFIHAICLLDVEIWIFNLALCQFHLHYHVFGGYLPQLETPWSKISFLCVMIECTLRFIK